MVSPGVWPIPTPRGGIEWHVYNLSNSLARLGCEIDLVSDIDESAYFHNGITIRRVNLPSLTFHQLGFAGYVLRNVMGGLFGFRGAHKSLKNGYDIIHAHGTVAPSMLSRFAKQKTPLVYTVHDDPPSKKLPHYLIYRTSYRLNVEGTAKRAARIIVLHADNVDYFTKIGVANERIRLIPHGIDADIFKPGLRNKDDYGLFVGALTRKKGVEYLLRAIAMVDEFNCLIVGDGPEKDYLIGLTQNLGIANRVRFIGVITSPAELADIYCGASFLVLPSITEGLPAVGLEALACGLPIVASNLPDIATIVRDDYNGLLAPPGSAEALAQKMKALINNRDLRRQMGERSLGVFKKGDYSLEAMTKSTLKLYEEVAGKGA